MARRAADNLVFLGDGVADYELGDLLHSNAQVLGRWILGQLTRPNWS